MLERTDTDWAPWHVIASNNKMRARLKGLKIVEDIVGKGIDDLEQPLDPKIAEAANKLWGWKPGEKKKNNKHH
jgi:polyphosphate kinase 2 (PPK2 family)